jgi:hypothetical protein
MNTSELAALPGIALKQSEFEDGKLTSGYTSDLLSDVMAHAEEGGVLITIQAHKNTVAVAALTGLRAVIICNRRPLPDDLLEAARAEGLAVFVTAENQFQTSCRVQNALHPAS